jgi:hypothetical protein
MQLHPVAVEFYFMQPAFAGWHFLDRRRQRGLDESWERRLDADRRRFAGTLYARPRHRPADSISFDPIRCGSDGSGVSVVSDRYHPLFRVVSLRSHAAFAQHVESDLPGFRIEVAGDELQLGTANGTSRIFPKGQAIRHTLKLGLVRQLASSSM